MAALISKPGLTSASTLSIPTNWSASWFRSLIASQLVGADVRNAVGSGGIVVSGNITSPYATIGFGAPVNLPGPVTITYNGTGASALIISTNSSTPYAIELVRSDLGAGDNIGLWNNAGTFQFSAPIQVRGTAANPVVTCSDGTVTGQLYFGAANFQIGASSNHPLVLFADNGAGTITLSTAGVVTFGQYGAGTLSTNASGVISASDGRFKVKTRPVENGIATINQLRPTYYRWTEDSPFYTDYEEIGFIAQEVAATIPAASPDPELPNRFKNYHDRAILAMLVKAVQELSNRIGETHDYYR